MDRVRPFPSPTGAISSQIEWSEYGNGVNLEFPSPTGAISSQIELHTVKEFLKIVSVPYRGNLISNRNLLKWKRRLRHSFRPLPGQSHLKLYVARLYNVKEQFCFRPLPGQSHLKYIRKKFFEYYKEGFRPLPGQSHLKSCPL